MVMLLESSRCTAECTCYEEDKVLRHPLRKIVFHADTMTWLKVSCSMHVGRFWSKISFCSKISSLTLDMRAVSVLVQL